MVMPPCKNCQNRIVGCHSNCEKYKEYRQGVDMVNRQIFFQHKTNAFVMREKKDRQKIKKIKID